MNPKVYFSFLLCSLFLVTSSFVNEQKSGKELFEQHCAKCHGVNGDKGFFGTGKLFKSKITDAEIITRIEKGKSIMPAFKSKLSESEIISLKDYVKTFRKN